MSSRTSEADATGGCPAGGDLASEFNPFERPYLDDPYPFWERARREQPVFYSESLDYWVVSRYDDVHQVFKDTDSFSAVISIEPLKPLCEAAIEKLVAAGLEMGPSLVNEDPPVHAQRRPIVRKALVSPERIAGMTPRIRELVTGYIDHFAGRGHADLVSEFAWEIPAVVALLIMGVPDEDVARAKTFSNRLALFTWGFPSEEEQTELAEGMGEYWKYAREHYARRLEEPTDDYLSEFIRQWREPGNEDLFDANYLIGSMMNFLFAGHETTTNATANGIRALLENREEWERLCQDPELIENAVEEILRYQSSVIAWRRIAIRDTEVGGVPIPDGARLLIATGSANHDERQFPEPERFDVTRENASRHMAFGWGRHKCLGAALARLEMKIILEELTRRLPHMRLVEGQRFEFSANTSFRGPERLEVEWDPGANPVAADRP